MKTKPKDILYCGVNEKAIKAASPVVDEEVFENLIRGYIIGRYTAHINKDCKKLPPPWSKNRIIQTYRFTNVRRELDKESKWLIKHVSTNKDLSYKDKLYNTLLFRLCNKHDTMEIYGAPLKFDELGDKIDEICITCDKYMADNPDYRMYGTAFFVHSIKNHVNQAYPSSNRMVSMIHFVKQLYDNNALAFLENCKTQQEVFEGLLGVRCLGRFLAYQVFIDFTYIEEFPYSENEFTVSGPGCDKGLNYLFKDKDGLTQEELLFWLRDNIEDLSYELLDMNLNFTLKRLMRDLPIEERYMNVMSLENCMCELGKYMDVINGVGRMRPKYKYKKGDTNEKR